MSKILLTVLVLVLLFTNPVFVYAGPETDNALNFLKSKQNQTGRITTGFSAPSQWSAIAFAANGIDTTTVKNPDLSLMDFLLTDAPTSQSPATDWETRILALTSVGGDPSNFGGVNYTENLEKYFDGAQTGDACSLNDDIFALLAQIASGEASSVQIKQAELEYLIAKQDPSDGGFGYSSPGCDWYQTSADMTAAAIQALVGAKANGLTSSVLDEAIEKSKTYLLNNQNPDGGFGYFGTSDADTTGWVVMAFNVLGLEESDEAQKARDWLLLQQSETDGGFQAFDYGINALVSNSTTTAQAVIALSGKGWILKVFSAGSAAVIPSPTASSSPSASPAPTITPTAYSAAPTPTPFSSPALSPSGTPAPAISTQADLQSAKNTRTPKPSTAPQVLGTSSQTPPPGQVEGYKSYAIPILSVTLLGLISFILYRLKLRRII